MNFESLRSPSQLLRPGPYTPSASDDAGRPRVLLLTSGLGYGHLRAAQAIEAALAPTAQVRMLDLWALLNPGVARACHQTYLALVQDHPDLYERLYHLDEQTWRRILHSESGLPPAVLEVFQLIAAMAERAGTNAPHRGRYASDRLLLTLLCAALPYEADSLAGNGVRARLTLMKWIWMRLIRRLEPAIRKAAPDVIVSTQMIPAAMVSHLKQRRKIDAPLLGVMTDFGVHDFWKQEGIDAYCVAHRSIAANLSSVHVDVVASGVPLMPGFRTPPSQWEARRKLQLPMGAPLVLVLGGGLGISVEGAAARLLEHPSPIHVAVLPGKNDAARATLRELCTKHPQRLRVYEWTERMDIFMRAADVIVGKPGGITVAEALACGRPLLATRSLGGQEGFNVNFLERQGVGGLVSDAQLLNRVQALLSERATLQQMQRRAWRLGSRNGADCVAELALSHAAAATFAPTASL
jgi:processive 1,2-diacylglycerol beta-glucosyltransferase